MVDVAILQPSVVLGAQGFGESPPGGAHGFPTAETSSGSNPVAPAVPAFAPELPAAPAVPPRPPATPAPPAVPARPPPAPPAAIPAPPCPAPDPPLPPAPAAAPPSPPVALPLAPAAAPLIPAAPACGPVPPVDPPTPPFPPPAAPPVPPAPAVVPPAPPSLWVPAAPGLSDNGFASSKSAPTSVAQPADRRSDETKKRREGRLAKRAWEVMGASEAGESKDESDVRSIGLERQRARGAEEGRSEGWRRRRSFGR